MAAFTLSPERALYDAWKREARGGAGSEAMEELLRALAVEARPSYLGLPLTTASHTRSYLNSNTFDPTSEKSLIFDAFVAMSPWSCALHDVAERWTSRRHRATYWAACFGLI